MVDYVLGKLEGQTATAVGELSHRFEAWQLAEDGEEIPYRTVSLESAAFMLDLQSNGSSRP